eukprot:3722200-Prymnesium_polylepis.1
MLSAAWLSVAFAGDAGEKRGFSVPKASAGPMLNNPCIDPTSAQSKQPWCDATLPVDERVKDMISRMTLNEKIDALDTSEKPI